MEQTNKDCRFRIFILSNSLIQKQFPNPETFACWKIRFKTEVCICSQFPTEATLWIKEVEMVDSVEDLKSSRSVRGIRMPDFKVLDAKIASALDRIIHNTQFKRKVSLDEQEAKKKAVSSEEDRLLTWSANTSGSLGPTILSRIMQTCLLLFFEMMIFRNSIRNGTKICHQWRKSHLMKCWKDCTNKEYECLRNSRPYWKCTIYGDSSRRKPDLIITMVKRSIEQNLRIQNFEARNGNYERKTPWSRIIGKTAWTKKSRRLLAVESQRAVF